MPFVFFLHLIQKLFSGWCRRHFGLSFFPNFFLFSFAFSTFFDQFSCKKKPLLGPCTLKISKWKSAFSHPKVKYWSKSFFFSWHLFRSIKYSLQHRRLFETSQIQVNEVNVDFTNILWASFFIRKCCCVQLFCTYYFSNFSRKGNSKKSPRKMLVKFTETYWIVQYLRV